MVSFPCLHWWIATSTHLQMKNEHVTVYALWFSFIVSFDGLLLLHFCKWRMTGSRVCLMVFPHCLLWWIATFTLLQMENGQWTVYASWFFYIISINGLLLLHFCKWRNGHVAVYSSLFFSSSPLTDCYFYTSANGEWQVAVYVLWFLFLVSIDGLILLHFCKWRAAVSRICFMVFLHYLH